MTLNVSYVNDLEVKSGRTPMDRAFFNRRFKALFDELYRLDGQITGFAGTEDTLIQLGLDRMNQVLGPMLMTVQSAAELGFLICEVIGENHSLVTGEFIGWHVTDGAQLFTPTPIVLAVDKTDFSNWGLLSIDEDGWHNTTGELSTHVVYSSKTQTSTQWSISASAALLPAMEDLLAQTIAAKDATAASAAIVAASMATLDSAIAAIESGPVSSVAGRSGAITLTQSDIAGLVDALAAKASNSIVNANLATKQNTSAKLDALVNLAWGANKVQYSTGAGTLSQFDITDFMKTLMDDGDASTALGTLGVSTFIKSLLDDADAAAARSTLGVAAPPDVPVKSSSAEIAIGTDDVKFATALGIADTYLPKIAGINNQTGTSYTLVAADNGKIVRFTNSGAVTCLLPAGVVIGHNTMIEQFGTGAVTINVATNATRRAFGSRFKLAGQYATASVFCELNSDGVHAEWNVSGNLIP